MNFGNMQNMSTAAMMSIQAKKGAYSNPQELAKMNQQKLFNDYVNVGISHRIASGLSSKVSGLINDNNHTNPQIANGLEKQAEIQGNPIDRTKSLLSETEGQNNTKYDQRTNVDTQHISVPLQKQSNTISLQKQNSNKEHNL